MGSRHTPRDVKKSGWVVRVGHCTHPAVNWNVVFGETVVYTCVEGSIVNLSVKVVEFARCIAGGVLPLSVTFFQPTVEL